MISPDFDKLLNRIEEAFIITTVFLMALILIGNVISRTVFNSSWTFAEEVSIFLLIVLTFVGTSYGARKGRHIRMSALHGFLPQKARKAIMILVSAVTAFTMFVLTYHAVLYVLKIYRMGTVSPALRVPMWLILIFVPVGLFLAGIEYSRTVWKNIKEKEVYVSPERTDDLRD